MAGNAIMQLIYLIDALSRIQCAPNDRSTGSSVRRALALHRKWAAGAPANYAAPYALIEGTWARARGQHRKAERYLDQAIELAEEHQLPLIGALAHEEAATLYAETGRATLREHMLRSAYQRWLSLGLAVRTDRLARAHPWLLSRDLVQTGSAGSTRSARISCCVRCRQRGPRTAWPTSCSARLRTRPVPAASCSSPAKGNI